MGRDTIHVSPAQVSRCIDASMHRYDPSLHTLDSMRSSGSCNVDNTNKLNIWMNHSDVLFAPNEAWNSGFSRWSIVSLRIKRKVYKTVVRPAMMDGAETWAVKKAQEKKLDVADMRMLRWLSGVTKLDRIRNERNRRTTKVGEISKKVQESRLK